MEWHSAPPEVLEPLRWMIFWGAVIGALGGFDLWRHRQRDGSTLSECVRVAFRTDTPAGKAAFLVFLQWLHRHILK